MKLHHLLYLHLTQQSDLDTKCDTSLKLIRVITDGGRGIGMPEDRPSYRRLAGTPCLEQTLLL